MGEPVAAATRNTQVLCSAAPLRYAKQRRSAHEHSSITLGGSMRRLLRFLMLLGIASSGCRAVLGIDDSTSDATTTPNATSSTASSSGSGGSAGASGTGGSPDPHDPDWAHYPMPTDQPATDNYDVQENTILD